MIKQIILRGFLWNHGSFHFISIFRSDTPFQQHFFPSVPIYHVTFGGTAGGTNVISAFKLQATGHDNNTDTAEIHLKTHRKHGGQWEFLGQGETTREKWFEKHMWQWGCHSPSTPFPPNAWNPLFPVGCVSIVWFLVVWVIVVVLATEEVIAQYRSSSNSNSNRGSS